MGSFIWVDLRHLPMRPSVRNLRETHRRGSQPIKKACEPHRTGSATY